MSARALLTSLLLACAPRFAVDERSLIRCTNDAECPAPFDTCAAGICQTGDVAIPAVTLAFSLPQDGEVGVALQPVIVIAFSLRVAPDSLDSRVRLVDPSGANVALSRLDEDGIGSTFRFAPVAALTGATRYTLHIDSGILPGVSGAAESDLAHAITFETRAGDLVAPSPVSALTVERLSDTHVRLTWQRPLDADYAGALILRRAAASVSDAPADGASYLSGAAIGNTAVLGGTVLEQWDDLTVSADPHDYAVFAFDTSLNYAKTLTRSPLLASETFTWCTDETAQLAATSPDPHTAVLVINDTPGAAPNVGEHNVWRTKLTQGDATTLGKPHPFFASPKTLAITAEPRGVGPGGTATMYFSPFAWPALEAEVDTSPVVSVETFAGATANLSGSVSAPFAAAGEYRLRVRPVVAGCVAAPWTTSAPFRVGKFLYVKPGANGSGVDPANALPTIAAALSAVTGVVDTTTIYVAGGTYTEPLIVPQRTEIHGSYSADFATRSLAPPTTHVLSATAPAISVQNGGPERVISGVRASSTDAVSNDVSVVEVRAGASASLTDCEIDGTPTAGSYSQALLLQNAGVVMVERCTIRGAPATDSSFAVYGVNTVVTLRDSSLFGSANANRTWGVTLNACQSVVDRVTISMGDDNGYAYALDVWDPPNTTLLLTNSVVRTRPATNASFALQVTNADTTTITNNTFIGGGMGDRSVWLTNSPATMTNNVFVNDDICVYNSTPASALTLDTNAFSVCTTLVESGTTLLDAICGGAVGNGGCSVTLTGSTGNSVHAALGFSGATDFHLTAATPAAVSKGGKDTGLTRDRDGASRSCPVPLADCFSIGAYER